jgi:hypothetical protein
MYDTEMQIDAQLVIELRDEMISRSSTPPTTESDDSGDGSSKYLFTTSRRMATLTPTERQEVDYATVCMMQDRMAEMKLNAMQGCVVATDDVFVDVDEPSAADVDDDDDDDDDGFVATRGKKRRAVVLTRKDVQRLVERTRARLTVANRRRRKRNVATYVVHQ